MSPLGDRMYLAFGSEVAALQREHIGAGRSRAIRRTGDRAHDDAIRRSCIRGHGTLPDIAVLDRYTGEQSESIRLPGAAKELRIDPLGRLLLARPDTGDSVWVINVGTNRGRGHTPDAVARRPSQRGARTARWPRSSAVTCTSRFRAPTPRIIVRDGAKEIWHFVFWNGFRPRAPGLDLPVVFPVDTAVLRRAAAATRCATVHQRPSTPRRRVRRSFPPTRRSRATTDQRLERPGGGGAFRGPRKGNCPHDSRRWRAASCVVVATVDGTRVYRVVMGPFTSRAEADRVGRESGRDYWVFEGVP